MQSCLYYYESVAESNDDPARVEEIRENKEKLARIIDKVKEEAKSTCISPRLTHRMLTTL